MITICNPQAPLETLKQRAGLLKSIRLFMEQRQILEVETPILSAYGNPDPNLDCFTTRFHSPASPAPTSLYLHTSPEFAMKRLLAAGSGPIYQITRVFRDRELGRYHQPEFTMLEWYRTGFDHHDLMDEFDELLMAVGLAGSQRRSYATVFNKYCGIDPHRALTVALHDAANAAGLQAEDPDRPLLLDFLFNRQVAPHLGVDTPEFIFDFPACQAGLARVRDDDPPLAERFELFINGVEIANGFHELIDAGEQLQRFQAENDYRRRHRLAEIALDQQLIAALEHGLPPCAGVAVGLDRLLMMVSNRDSIEGVIAFPFKQL